MSDQDSIFEGNKEESNVGVPTGDQPKGAQEENPVQSNDASEDLLRMITNESGEPKYKSVKDALVGLSNAQQHIPKVEEDNAKLRSQLEAIQAEVAKKDAALEALDRFAQKQDDSVGQPAAQPALDEGAVSELVTNVLTKRETEAQQQANIALVTSTLKSKFGEKAGEAFYGKADELGMSKQEINKLASSSPKAVLQLFGEVESSSVKPSVSTINSEALKPKQQDVTGQLAPPTKSVMAGATAAELAAEMSRHREAVYAKHGIEG